MVTFTSYYRVENCCFLCFLRFFVTAFSVKCFLAGQDRFYCFLYQRHKVKTVFCLFLVLRKEKRQKQSCRCKKPKKYSERVKAQKTNKATTKEDATNVVVLYGKDLLSRHGSPSEKRVMGN